MNNFDLLLRVVGKLLGELRGYMNTELEKHSTLWSHRAAELEKQLDDNRLIQRESLRALERDQIMPLREALANPPEATLESTPDDIDGRLKALLQEIPAGDPGQDRPLVEPVEIKAGRDYPKNTTGTFAGGLWISRKHATGNPEEDPHAWHCILDGISGISVKLLADHTFELSLKMSTGAVKAHPFKIPFPEHKGLYTEGELYMPGQIVTKGAAWFQAIEETEQSPPGNGWQQVLVAKINQPRRPPGGKKDD